MYIVEHSIQDVQLWFKKSGILFWQRQSLSAGKVTACTRLVVVTRSQIFHLRSIFPHLLSKNHHPGKLPVLRLMANMHKRGQMAQCRLQSWHRACSFCIELCSHYIQFLSYIFRNVLVSLEKYLSFLCLCFPISSLLPAESASYTEVPVIHLSGAWCSGKWRATTTSWWKSW